MRFTGGEVVMVQTSDGARMRLTVLSPYYAGIVNRHFVQRKQSGASLSMLQGVCDQGMCWPFRPSLVVRALTDKAAAKQVERCGDGDRKRSSPGQRKAKSAKKSKGRA